MFHHTRAAIEAHLTIVFTALALSRESNCQDLWIGVSCDVLLAS